MKQKHSLWRSFLDDFFCFFLFDQCIFLFSFCLSCAQKLIANMPKIAHAFYMFIVPLCVCRLADYSFFSNFLRNSYTIYKSPNINNLTDLHNNG